MNATIATSEPRRLGDTIYNLSESKFHGRRDDGVYVPIYIDGMADADVGKRLMAEMAEERTRLVSAGQTVL